jgi:hypothetical protein
LRALIVPLVAAALSLAACASQDKDSAERAWQRAECDRVLDKEDRERCLRRADGFAEQGRTRGTVNERGGRTAPPR